jgi:formylmethanofuran dehydrogenase subunit C
MAAGEFVVGNKAGAYIKLTALGDIVLVPAAGRNVLLGAAGATVARVGDAVAASGTDPQGGTVSVTGTITAGSSEVKA